jgi:outer membrane protein assembly factor BamB
MRGYGSSTPAVRQDGVSYFSVQSGLLYAVDSKGKKVWSYQAGQQADSDPIVTREGTLIYSADDGSAYALNPDGTLKWKSDSLSGPGEVDAGLAETCDGKVIAGGAHGFFALDVKSGKTLWSVPATGGIEAVFASPLVAADGTVYAVDSGGIGYAIDTNGKVLWQKSLGMAGAAGSPAKIGKTLYVVLNDGALHAVDAATGTLGWSQPIGDGQSTYQNGGPVIDGNMRIYVNSNDGNVYAFDRQGKQLWKQPASGTPKPNSFAGTIAIGSDGTLYVPGNDGKLYALE